MKRLGFTVVAVGMITALGACSNGIPLLGYYRIGNFVSDDVAAVKAMDCKGSAFDQALKKEYVALAETELAESDHQHADIFIQKAQAACEGSQMGSSGGQVLPEDLDGWWIPAKEDAELRKARPELVSLLDGNARTRAPEVAARAQAMFDCWVEEAHEDIWLRQPGVEVYEPQEIKRCKDGYYAAIAELKGLGKAEKFIVFFAFDKSNIDAKAAAVLDKVVAAAKAGMSARVAVFGYTDTAGPASYNVGLSKRRAQAVVNYLTRHGIAGSRITATGLGETNLRVPTPDNTPNRQNRRAEITVQ